MQTKTKQSIVHKERSKDLIPLGHARMKDYDFAPAGYFIFDPHGTIESVNLTGARMLGTEVRPLVKKPFLAFILRNDWNIFYTHLREVFAKQQQEICELRLKRADRLPLTVELRSIGTIDSSGMAQHCQTVVLDISERKEIQILGKWADIFNNAQIGIVVSSPDGKTLEMMNPAFAAMHGYTIGELTGKPTLDVIAPGERKKFPSILRMAEAKKFYTLETFHLRRDGSVFPVEITVTIVHDVQEKIRYRIINCQDITERKRIEDELGRLGHLYEMILASAGDGIFGVDVRGNNTFVNRAAATMLGYETFELVGKDSHSLWHQLRPDGSVYPIEQCPIYETYRKGTVQAGEEVFWKKDGTNFPVYFTSRPLFEKDSIVGAVVTFQDIARRKESEDRIRQLNRDLEQRNAELRASKEFSDALNSIDAVIHSTLDLETIMERVLTEAAQAIKMDGSSVGLFQDGNLSIHHIYNMPQGLKEHLFSPQELRGITDAMLTYDAVGFNDVERDERLEIEVWKSFGIRALLAAPLVIREKAIGLLSFYCLTAPCDFTETHTDFVRKLSASLSLALENAGLYKERKQMEETMRHMALHDALTGLANRHLLLDLVPLELAQARRNRNKVAILFLDLDRFKDVNDTLGHEAGDGLLKEVAGRLKASIRASDTVVRIGGDEFNIILADVNRPEDVSLVAHQILNAFQKPFLVAGHYLHMTTSIGISIYPDDSKQIDTLFRYADIAMYDAKEHGRNTYRFYSHDINVRSLERMKMESYLRHTIERKELDVYYQPQIDIKSGKIFCAEALVRWHHPQMGLLLPKKFIPLAEETGFITVIDEWVLKTVCEQRKSWLDAGITDLCLTVNLSQRQFQNPELIKNILRTLEETGIPPHSLSLEITESMAMRDVERTAERFQELKSKGIRISIDDFGTGYSSLSYLKRLPLYQLKIDQSFIQDIGTDPDNRAIITAVTTMAHSLRMRVIAEGVETEEQLLFLRSIGCDEAQGFLFGKPLPADEFSTLMTTEN